MLLCPDIQYLYSTYICTVYYKTVQYIYVLYCNVLYMIPLCTNVTHATKHYNYIHTMEIYDSLRLYTYICLIYVSLKYY